MLSDFDIIPLGLLSPVEGSFFLYTTKDANRKIEKFDSPTHVLVEPSVPEIPDGCFCQNKRLTSIAIPSGLKRIGDRSFFQCHSLIKMNFPSSLHEIGLSAFTECVQLTSVDFADDEQWQLLRIGGAAFSHCTSLLTVRIPPTVTSIGKRCFCNCADLVEMDLTSCSDLKAIESRTFLACTSLRRVRLPFSIEYIGSHAFSQCYDLLSISIDTSLENPSCLITIQESAFASCRSLRRILLPRSLKRIGHHAFSNCFGLVSVQFDPEGQLTGIGDKVFFSCKNLVNISLPETIYEMGDEVFLACEKLNQRFLPDQDNSFFLSDALSIRFHGLPIHQACYDQSNHITERTMVELETANSPTSETPTSWIVEDPIDFTRHIDIFGFTPLHVLVLSINANPALVQALMANYQWEETEPIIWIRDIWGKVPLYYACLSDSSLEMVTVLLGYYQQGKNRSLKNQEDWEEFIDASLPNSLELVQLMVTQSVANRLKSLGSVKWKNDILNNIAGIPQASSDRRRHIRSVYEKLKEYEKEEVFALVKSAAWKAKLDQLSAEMYSDFSIRMECRVHCGDDVVISNVLPFLGDYVLS